MSLTIKTNTSSLIAQNSLKTSTSKLNQAIERMSSGAKINHAKDNAANYSIATNMTTKINALQVAEDNCAMGLDLISTASSSLEQMSDLTSRLRSLATQAQNGTYGSKSIEAINTEAQAIIQEMSRIKDTTQYNGIKLFDGNTQVDGTSAISTYALQNRAVSSSTGFIEQITRRDTSSMTTLASVDESTAISSGTYSISTAEELAKLATMTNNGLVTGGEFVLADDIDLSGYSNWTPIGLINVNTFDGNAFIGTFDGNGYVVSNMTITTAGTSSYYGLFGAVAGNSTVKNIGLENSYITNLSGTPFGKAGSLIGCTLCSDIDNPFPLESILVQNCYATGSMQNLCNAGGLISLSAYNNLKIESCYTDVDISIDPFLDDVYGDDYLITAGGLIGAIQVGLIDMNNCYTVGSVNVTKDKSGQCCTGGLLGACLDLADTAGLGTSSIKNCFAIGEVLWKSSNGGGFAGTISQEDILTNCSYNNVNNKGVRQSEGDSDFLGITAKSEAELKAMLPTLYKCNDLASVIGFVGFSLQMGINSNSQSQIDFEIGGIDVSALNSIDMSDSNSISKIDEILSKINDQQTTLGAAQNRLESALDEISTQYENLVSSRSTIMDADMAEVSSEYIRQQILQEASATLMATANQSPSIALQLL